MSGGETLGRCKQCGAPITLANMVKGPTGLFCSPDCRTRHEAFVQKAAQIEQRERPVGGLFFVRLRSALTTLIVLAVLGACAAFLGDLYGFQIPIVSRLYHVIRQSIGI